MLAGVESRARKVRRNDGTLQELAETVPIANADEAWNLATDEGEPRVDTPTDLFLMWAGQMGTVRAFGWARHVEDAFEEFVEYLDDEAPGMLTDVTEQDLKEAAEYEGFAWQKHWPDYEDPEFEKVVQRAEADLTIIGHTTLNHGQYIASYEWGGDEITNEAAWRIVFDRSIEASEDEE